ncbi:MAG: branched-chain amino acid ABC transporter permease [Bacillota bacterium]|nr:branched-chain amino acid ABC transporter permease [Bacillota bacterium]
MEYYILNGLVLGGIYALIALGLNIIWSITHIPDFSQGGIYVIGAYVAYFVITLANLHWLLAILIATLTGACLSFLIEKFLYKRWRGQVRTQLLCAIALFFLIANLAILFWTPKAKNLAHYVNGMSEIFGVAISYQRLFIIAVVVLMSIALIVFMRSTKFGKAVRAAAQDLEAAPWMGIDVNQIYSILFIIGGSLSAMAGALIAPLFAVYPMMGDLPLMKALIVVILGGFGSITGTLFAGFGVGILESFGAAYISAEYQHGYPFIILIIVLLIRPQGLFGVKGY